MSDRLDSNVLPPGPFIEFIDPDPPEESDLIVGFRESREIASQPVPIGRRSLFELFAGTPYRVSIDSDGTLQPRPDSCDEEGFVAKLKAVILEKKHIDTLAEEMIDSFCNEPDFGVDGILSDLHEFLDRLKRATDLLEQEIGRRVSRALTDGSSPDGQE